MNRPPPPRICSVSVRVHIPLLYHKNIAPPIRFSFAPSTPTPDSTDSRLVPATRRYLDARPLTQRQASGVKPRPYHGLGLRNFSLGVGVSVAVVLKFKKSDWLRFFKKLKQGRRSYAPTGPTDPGNQLQSSTINGQSGQEVKDQPSTTLPKDGAPHFGLASPFQRARSAGATSSRNRNGTRSESYRDRTRSM